jgi:hypothetical protein
MVEGQKKSLIGRGMKPRGNKAVKAQKETKSMKDESTTEGQEESTKQPVLEAQEGNETPSNLEPEKEPESLQNLEKSEVTVARDLALEAALNESGDVIDAEFEEVPEVEHVLGSSAAPIVITAAEAEKFGYAIPGGYDLKLKNGTLRILEPPPSDATEPSRNLQPMVVEKGSIAPEAFKAIESSYGSVKFTEEPGEMWITKDGIRKIMETYGIGPQADGSKGYVVKVEENYWGAVEEWAESDGISPEDWLRNLLYGAISTYGEPAKGR